ncbi:MAG: glycosyltransferase [Bacteroidia bacterium]
MANIGLNNSLLAEVSWEVCNQLGGIYTVIRSKLPEIVKRTKGNYLLVGPYVDRNIIAEIEPITDENDAVGKAVAKLKLMGYEVIYGHWLVSGSPRVVLINPDFAFNRIENIEQQIFNHFHIDFSDADDLVKSSIMFGDVVKIFFKLLNTECQNENINLIGHFHEWMSAVPLLQLKIENVEIKSVFTTHATLLGRYLAAGDKDFYKKLPNYKWEKEAKRMGIGAQAGLEYYAAHIADTFTTVSGITSEEFEHLYKKPADVITPNGINSKRYFAQYEIQSLHNQAKTKLHRFSIGHFFHNYTFDLDKTIYLFTSGRYEYVNKGYDLTLEALSKLNKKMIEENIDKTVVFFLITRKPAWSINPNVLENRGIMEEVVNTCKAMVNQVRDRVVYEAVKIDDHSTPDLNELVDDYWKLRLKRTLQKWKSKDWPLIITHNLKDDVEDEVLNSLREKQLFNSKLDKVKVVYHPDFIESTNPLFGIDYDDFVRGCHMGVFPSFYEPWGYTPLECIARGVPTVTSDLSGFGNFINDLGVNLDELSIHVNKRKGNKPENSAENLSKFLLNFVKRSRQSRLEVSSALEEFSEEFDWKNMIKYYLNAYSNCFEEKEMAIVD